MTLKRTTSKVPSRSRPPSVFRDWNKLPVEGIPLSVKLRIEEEQHAWDQLPAELRSALEMERYQEPPVAKSLLDAFSTGSLQLYNIRRLIEAFRTNSYLLWQRDIQHTSQDSNNALTTPLYPNNALTTPLSRACAHSRSFLSPSLPPPPLTTSTDELCHQSPLRPTPARTFLTALLSPLLRRNRKRTTLAPRGPKDPRE